MNSDSRLTQLRCEYLDNPAGIDEVQPRLSWVLESERRGARQVAYRVAVASSLEILEGGKPDLWDSGRVESDQSTHVVYDGTPLSSRMTCYWQATVWDELGNTVTHSPVLWTMGLLHPADWQAAWIAQNSAALERDDEAIEPTAETPGTPAIFRKTFSIPGTVRRATLYATARGLVAPRMNGQSITPDQFIPEWTDYHKRLHYRTFDVTNFVASGENTLAATLGDGWWSGYVGWQETRGQYGTLENSMLMQLEVELETGELIVVATDRSWTCSTGPILSSDFMMGETYDARREQQGWDSPTFDDSQWLEAVEVAPPRVRIPEFAFSNNQPSHTERLLPLVAQRSEPVRIVETLQPISFHKTAGGAVVYDFGQNFAGWVEITVRGSAGTRVQLRHAERLNPDGTIYTDNLRRAKATDVYILKGSAREVWQPHFTFHGFQYLEITGLKEALPPEQIRGCVVMSDTKQAGDFECSHPLVNRLWKNAQWGQKGNFLSVPTDCPQRDERLGWMGDAQIFMRTATYNMDVAAFFTKWMDDICDSQDVDGVFPDVAPRLNEADNFIGLDGLGGGAGWADAGIIVPWTMWHVYGDRRIVERHWDSMTRWLDWLEATNPDGIRRQKLGNNYGDWLCIPADTSFRTHSEMKYLLATAYWAHDAAMMHELADVLGRKADAARYVEMLGRVRSAFQHEWVGADGRLSVETQTAYLLALAFDLVPQELRGQSAERLVQLIEQDDWHLTTGFIGIKHLNPVLTAMGYADVAGRLLTNEDYPSWLYPILHGATTIWERWNGWTLADGFFNPQMNSFNHYSLGSVAEWLYQDLAGIELDPVVPGFKKLMIKPHVTGGLDHAFARYRSMHGTIESDWRLVDGDLELDVCIPANTQATVYYPSHPESVVLEGDAPANQSPGVRALEHDGAYAIFEVTSGRYQFRTGS